MKLDLKKLKAVGVQAETAFETTDNDNDCNSKPLPQLNKIYLADFAINTPEFELLKKKFMHPKAAVALQHLEFLNRHFGVPSEGVFRNIYPSGNLPYDKTISGHIGIKSRRLIFPILDEIRAHYTFQKGVKLVPDEIDFKGKLYASFYLPSHASRTVYWFRNAKLINEFCAKIKQELVDLKEAKKLKYVMPQETLCEPWGEPSSAPSYTKEEEELKKLEKEKYKAKNSLTLVPFLINKKTTKTSGKTSSCQDETKVKKSSPVKEENNSVTKLGEEIYPFYKDYCISRENDFLMPDIPVGADARRLDKFAQSFYGVGFMQHDLPQFFAMLASEHVEAVEYLKEHGVWEVKNHKILFDIPILVKESHKFASWYRQLKKETPKADFKIKSAPIESAPETHFELKSIGFTYEERMANEKNPESMEYQCVFFEKCKYMEGSKEHFISLLQQESLDFPASLARIEKLRLMTLDELLAMPFPK